MGGGEEAGVEQEGEQEKGEEAEDTGGLHDAACAVGGREEVSERRNCRQRQG